MMIGLTDGHIAAKLVEFIVDVGSQNCKILLLAESVGRLPRILDNSDFQNSGVKSTLIQITTTFFGKINSIDQRTEERIENIKGHVPLFTTI
jgi:hypothetical protein